MVLFLQDAGFKSEETTEPKYSPDRPQLQDRSSPQKMTLARMEELVETSYFQSSEDINMQKMVASQETNTGKTAYSYLQQSSEDTIPLEIKPIAGPQTCEDLSSSKAEPQPIKYMETEPDPKDCDTESRKYMDIEPQIAKYRQIQPRPPDDEGADIFKKLEEARKGGNRLSPLKKISEYTAKDYVKSVKKKTPSKINVTSTKTSITSTKTDGDDWMEKLDKARQLETRTVVTRTDEDHNDLIKKLEEARKWGNNRGRTSGRSKKS